jgi:hypothetical protein
VNADHAAQLRLLDLQAADTAIAQLTHRRSTLPELAALVALAEQSGRLADDVVDVETRLSDIVQDQRRLENEVDVVRTRAGRDEQRLQAGGLPAKELEGLQHEITSLARRQSTLEDELLEVMELRESADAQAADIAGRRSALGIERARLESDRDAAITEIDSAAALRGAERAGIAAELPADLLALYERARAHSGGVGAAQLRQRRCEGCHIELSGSEVAALRAAAPDEVVRCDNCRRILVRTADSGL